MTANVMVGDREKCLTAGWTITLASLCAVIGASFIGYRISCAFQGEAFISGPICL